MEPLGFNTRAHSSSQPVATYPIPETFRRMAGLSARSRRTCPAATSSPRDNRLAGFPRSPIYSSVNLMAIAIATGVVHMMGSQHYRALSPGQSKLYHRQRIRWSASISGEIRGRASSPTATLAACLGRHYSIASMGRISFHFSSSNALR